MNRAAVVVTGRNGFLASALAPKLKQDFKIISVIRRKMPGIDYSGEKLILRDLKELTAADCQSPSIQLIVHLASELKGRPESLEENNLKSSAAVFQIARELNVPVVLISSINAAFADSNQSGYSRSKKKSEDLLKGMDVRYLIIRLPLLFGAASPLLKRVKDFYDRFGFCPLLGKSQGKIQPADLKSVADFLLLKIKEGKFLNETIHVVGRREYTYQQIFEAMLNQKRKPRFIRLPFSLSLGLAKILVRLPGPFLLSPEQVLSVNQDKVVSSERHGAVYFLDNEPEELFR